MAAPTGSNSSPAPINATIQKPANGASTNTRIANAAILVIFLMVYAARKPRRSERRPRNALSCFVSEAQFRTAFFRIVHISTQTTAPPRSAAFQPRLALRMIENESISLVHQRKKVCDHQTSDRNQYQNSATGLLFSIAEKMLRCNIFSASAKSSFILAGSRTRRLQGRGRARGGKRDPRRRIATFDRPPERIRR